MRRCEICGILESDKERLVKQKFTGDKELYRCERHNKQTVDGAFKNTVNVQIHKK